MYYQTIKREKNEFHLLWKQVFIQKILFGNYDWQKRFGKSTNKGWYDERIQ